MIAEREKMFRDYASKVGERTRAIVVCEVTHNGQIAYFSDGDLVSIGGLIASAQAFFSKQSGFQVETAAPAADPNQLPLPLGQEHAHETPPAPAPEVAAPTPIQKGKKK